MDVIRHDPTPEDTPYPAAAKGSYTYTLDGAATEMGNGDYTAFQW
jgi:hypothetical protein